MVPATTGVMMAKKKNVSGLQLMTWYIEYVSEKGKKPVSAAHFAKQFNFDETIFHKHYDSFKELEQVIFRTLFETSVETVVTSDEYAIFNKKDKLLSIYYTFFENLSLNRDYVAFILKDYGASLRAISVLSQLKESYTQYVDELDLQELGLNIDLIEPIQKVSIKESSWVQLLFTLKFWMDDTSADFEKTDVFIEKSINTSIDLIDTKTLNNIIDLGKFLYKEKFQSK